MRRSTFATGTGGVELVSESDDMAEIPILGRVAAGQPILAVEQATDTVRVDRVLIGGHREVFGLRIVGESMIEDGIFDGDYVFVKKTPSAKTGEIVVAMIEGEATVKRYFPEGDRDPVPARKFQHGADHRAPSGLQVRGHHRGRCRGVPEALTHRTLLSISGNGNPMCICQTGCRWLARVDIAAGGCGFPLQPSR